ncbi:sulfotransferase domain-containing protein [Polycladomyces subterraneus]|uniref:Sulfotransferase domain-containing protein n=1 Tax=Polycladomyces subterraneus TaxID=1016997 RepID=A0ABT8IKA2_9BACL|nr:sulfotransferase domain-containing protein [Polycladomyces subterraneus]MDN4593226.1 sulfotransferase domain-containing protein [Polycladomyces subterraneus]
MSKNHPKILVNTVPKSGTHLMLQLVAGIPEIRFATSCQAWINPQNIHELHKMLPGELVCGHIKYSKNNHRLLQECEVKQIFVYRDFRDIVVSYAHFIINDKHEHPLYSFYDRYLNRRFEDLVSHLIAGVQHPKCNYPGVYEEFRHHFPWREIPGILVLRYEDLVRDQKSRFNTCRIVLDYLYGNSMNEKMKEIVIHMMMSNAIPDKSKTYRRGRIGDWKTELNDMQKETLKKQVGPLLIKWGYEKDENW